MDVVLHYKNQQGPLQDLIAVAEKALEDFPCAPLPRFTPWYPTDSTLPLTPRKRPPVILPEEAERIEGGLCSSQPLVASQGYDCTVGLLEFCTRPGRARTLQRASSLQAGPTRCQDSASEGGRGFRRSWSVSVPGRMLGQEIHPLSGPLRGVVEGLGLHSLQRAKWVIEESNCSRVRLEHTWEALSRAMRRCMLPSCHANIQRDTGQIWVFCDIVYCEYIGHFLKEQLRLVGAINLVVHKHGTIFSM
ncbi:shieldin complex subunit 3 [Amia ocellicauda]|uniref:shieldin complex subunit 3 n=1 Tax=Amia ocellicauda TaxID=2972642 RepID=UPI003463CDC2